MKHKISTSSIGISLLYSAIKRRFNNPGIYSLSLLSCSETTIAEKTGKNLITLFRIPITMNYLNFHKHKLANSIKDLLTGGASKINYLPNFAQLSIFSSMNCLRSANQEKNI